MSWVTVLWSMVASVSLTLALINLLVWSRDRRSWAHLCFSIMVVGVLGLVFGELLLMKTASPEEYGRVIRWMHLVYAFGIVGSLGFVQFYFGTGRRWLFAMALGLRLLAVVINFTTGLNLHFSAIHSLQKVTLLGEQVSVLGEWSTSPFANLGFFASLIWLIYIADASVSLWRTGLRDSRRRAAIIGGSLVFFCVFSVGQVALIVGEVVRSPFMTSLPFLVVVLAMSYELSRDVLRAAQLGQDLRESLQQMTLAAEAANLGIWIRDLVRNEIWASEKWRELLGFTKSESLDLDKFFERIHPEDREGVRQAMTRATDGGAVYQTEYRVSDKGQTRWIASQGQVDFLGPGKPVRVRGVSIDITERKSAEEELRESEARFRSIANSAPIMIWIAGTDKLCTFFNKGWLDFTGRSLEQELGDGWAEGVHPDDLARCLKVYGESFDARRPFTMEYRLRRNDGEYRWLSDYGVPRHDSERNFLGYIGSCVDLTERKRAEEKFELAVEASPNGIVLVNDQGRMVLVNAEAEKLFCYSREEMIGQAVELLVPERYRRSHPDDRAGFFAAPQSRAMGAGRELFARRKDGTEFPVEIGLSPIQSAEGLLVLTAIVDITARKEAEAETLQQRDELAHLSRVTMLGELSSSLAHELNQPLAAILRNTEAAELFLQFPSPDLEELGAILADIRIDDQRAGAVIDRMRSMLKRREIEHILLDVKMLAGEVMSLARQDAVSRKVKFLLETTSSTTHVRGDRVQLQQVLLNLLMNAMDAVNGSSPDRRLVTLSVKPAGTQVEVAVSDTGHGIPTDKLPRLFEPFFTTKPNGMGMGLAISRSIIAAHGGKLIAANNPDGGARFYFALPMAKEENPS